MKRVAVFGVLVGLALATASGADAYVYWADRERETIGRANLNGNDIRHGFVPRSGSAHIDRRFIRVDIPEGIAVDAR